MIVERYLILLLITAFIASISGQESDFDDKTCGRQLVNLEGLVKGGFKARAGEWPWHVALFHRVLTTDQFDYQCGGTLVHKYLVVTAAHCVTRRSSEKHKQPGDILVKVGRFNISEDQEEQGRDHEVNQIVTHRTYKHLTYENDIAILKLVVPVIFTQYVQPACLWKRDDGIVLPRIWGRDGTVIGWGLSDDNKTSSLLNMARMPVVTIHECLESDRNFFGKLINAKSFCAGHKNGTGVCNGDSGGGMFFKHQNQWYLRGVVSFSSVVDIAKICNLKQYVGFTDAGLYLDWIYENAPINENITDPILGHPNIRLINQGDCGKNDYIFGYAEERKAVIQQYPWMVALRHPFQNQQFVPCNGVLINRNYILTTNCVDWNDDVGVTLGEYITGQVTDCDTRYGGEFCTSPVQMVATAEYFDKDGLLILARLSSPALIGRRGHIEAICLPTALDLRDRIYPKYVLTGWKESGNDSQYLQRAVVDLIHQAPCKEEISNAQYTSETEKNITDKIICVRNLEDPNWTPRCEDYQPGTAIQAIEKKSNRYFLYGIQTGISYCTRPERFIAVSKYLLWILDNIRP